MSSIINISDANDILLRSIAKKIQLSPTLYERAVERYETIYAHLKRPGSALRDFLVRMYPQGSMMIGASISSKVDSDEFDIDLMLELLFEVGTDPRWILNEVFEAIRGEYGSRYYNMTKRKTRCVTVAYADMHLDVTPAILLPGRLERTSHIFHAKEEEPEFMDETITANPWGFGEWFSRRTPLEAHLREAVVIAMAEPVKEQQDVEDKSLALRSLQLIKRWRNLRYAERDGRKPPSVLISKIVGDAATGRNRSLFVELTIQVAHLISVFEAAATQGNTVYVDNPACPNEDVFSDRWPNDLDEQKLFIRDLKQFQADLFELGNATLDRKAEILKYLFGENAAQSSIEEFREALGRQAMEYPLRHDRRTGGIAFGASGLVGGQPSSDTYSAPRHSFFGSPTESK